MISPKPPSPPPSKPYPATNFQNASGDPNNASGFGEKAATQLQRETRTDDIDLLPLSGRKRMLIHPDMPSKYLNVRQVIPDFSKEWPGLPKGVKFDPSDEELLWHLLAEIGKGVATRHPFIKEFIVSFDEDDGLGNVHPQFLPGVKQDGRMSYFFHRKVETHSNRKFKKQKQHDIAVEFYWHGNGKLSLVCVDSIHQGFKEVLTLYMNPVNGGDAVKTPWSMHQYHIGIDGAEEDLVVSKIFYKLRSRQNIRDSQTDFVDGFVTEVVAAAAPIQVFATPTPAEPTIEELYQKVVDHNIGGETNAEHGGCLKAAGSRKYPTTYLEKARINRYKHSEGTLATGELPLSESSCKAAAEICPFSTSAKSEISVKDEEECVVGKRTDGFLACLGDFGISISNSNYDNVIGDDTCDSNVHTSMEKSCPEKVPEHVLQKNVVDKMFKTQGKFIATRSGEINTTGVCSSTGHTSMKKHETYSKCLDEAQASLSKISSADHSIAHANMINDLFVLGLPACRLKGKLSRETGSKSSLKKNSNNSVDTSSQSALPIKIEPESLQDTEIGIASDFFSNNGSNASASTDLLIKVKTEPFEKAEASIIHVEKVPSFSHSSLPVNSSNFVNFCFSKANIQEKIPHIYNSKEGTPSCNLSHHSYVPSTENLSTKISYLDELLSETTPLINQHPEKDDNVQDGLLMSNGNSQVIGDSECYPQINVHAGEPWSNSVSSSNSLNVKSEPVERSLPTYSQIPPCNTRGLASLMFENKIELCSDSPLDIFDNVPLNHRLGISISEGDVNVERGNISEESAPVAPPHCHSFGSADTKECPSSSRRKRKKTATICVEKAMEEDAPGLLKILLDRGIQVEEIKLYGDLEDNDPLETSSSEGSFEELETLMNKLFSERSSLLRFSSGRPMKGSGAFYFLAGLISLIEQTRYMRFRQIPVDWGWCRDLRSFIFVFQTHNRIVLERPEYGYATYFFELVDSLPVDWQIKRLVKAMKLTNCSRTILLENKPLIVGEDVSEGEARVLEAYGWTRNTGVGTLLNYVDRVVHDRRNVMHSSEWRAKIKKLLMRGYNGGRMVLTNIPEKAVDSSGTSEIKMEL